MERAEALAVECLELARASGDEWIFGHALNTLALLASNREDYERADGLWGEASARARKAGDLWAVCGVTYNLGYSALVRGDLERAQALAEEGLAVSEQFSIESLRHGFLFILGTVATRRDDHARAKRLLSESLELGWEHGEEDILGELLESLAKVAGSLGDYERAARLWGAADASREKLGIPWSDAACRLHEPYLRDIRSRSDARPWERAWEEGQAMTMEEAVRHALSEEESAPSVPQETLADEGAGELTPREREIAELVARGLTNRQIASELFISERTVATHLGRVFKKLEVHSRERVTELFAEPSQARDSA
jgi:ATP/maltotriose-dependent transcriptional regulator MalT